MTFKAYMLSFTYKNEMDTVTDDKCGNDHKEAVFYIVSGRLGRDKDHHPYLFFITFFQEGLLWKKSFWMEMSLRQKLRKA